MEPRAARMHVADLGVIVVSMIALWLVMALVVREALRLTADPAVRTMLVAAAVVVTLFATAALVAVVLHLRRHRERAYAEDLAHQSNRHSETLEQ